MEIAQARKYYLLNKRMNSLPLCIVYLIVKTKKDDEKTKFTHCLALCFWSDGPAS